MSKRLDCFVEGCEGTIEAEIMSQVEDHAATAHPDLERDDETVQTVRDHIQDE